MAKVIQFSGQKNKKEYTIHELLFMPSDIFRWSCGKINFSPNSEYCYKAILMTDDGNTTSFYIYNDDRQVFCLYGLFHLGALSFCYSDEWHEKYTETISKIVGDFSSRGAVDYEDCFQSNAGWEGW
jgi:hypothetical protein